MNKKNLRKGFTTVELVIVIAVIAILATALIPTFGGLIDSANNTKAMQAARQIYNDYLLEATKTDSSVASADYYIKAEGKYFKVEGGKLNTTADETVKSAADVDAHIKIITGVTTTETATKDCDWDATTKECKNFGCNEKQPANQNGGNG